MGQRYRLRVVEGSVPMRVVLRGKAALDLFVRPETSTERREELLQAFYRAELKKLIPTLLDKWQPILGVEANAWGIKKMKTKWGSCNTDAARTLFNLELAKKPYECLEYIVVHELVHLLVRTHNDEFKALMDLHILDWKQRKTLLKDQPLTDL